MKNKLLFILLLLLISPLRAQNETQAWVINIQGAIGPAIADHLSRTIVQAQGKARLIIIQMDTPGGLDKSMRSIAKAILASDVPIASFVAPRGARAASAGTFILYASPIAAMAPGTNLGAASPVSVGGGMAPGESEKKKKNQATTIKKKVTNDASAYIRSLAQLHGRNVRFAVKAVQDAATLTAKEALQKNVITLMANDLDDLVRKLDGKTVLVNNQKVVLNTKNLQLKQVQKDWRAKFLSVISDPSVAYILLLIGIYGLFFEFANPGFVVPGVVGAISIFLALYAFQMLPINYAGMGLLLLGIIFMIAEAFAPSFGALGIGGVIAFVVGSVLLFDHDLPAYQIAWPLVLAMALANALFFCVIMGMAIRAKRSRIVAGRENMLGKTGVALEKINPCGQAKITGELWHVCSDELIEESSAVSVVDIDGITLKVKKMN